MLLSQVEHISLFLIFGRDFVLTLAKCHFLALCVPILVLILYERQLIGCLATTNDSVNFGQVFLYAVKSFHALLDHLDVLGLLLVCSVVKIDQFF